MKVLKKISLVYTLQVFAVILLFGYPGSSSRKESKAPATNEVLPFKANEYSSISAEINAQFKINTSTGK